MSDVNIALDISEAGATNEDRRHTEATNLDLDTDVTTNPCQLDLALLPCGNVGEWAGATLDEIGGRARFGNSGIGRPHGAGASPTVSELLNGLKAVSEFFGPLGSA